jgi:hypothetical protein
MGSQRLAMCNSMHIMSKPHWWGRPGHTGRGLNDRPFAKHFLRGYFPNTSLAIVANCMFDVPS